MEEPALVLDTKAIFGLYPGACPVFFDLLWQQWAYPERLISLSHQSKGWQPDVKIYLEGEQNNFRLVLEAVADDTRLMVDKRELYEAPQGGYRSKVVIPFNAYERGASIDTRIYVKGRGGQFFSKMHLSAGIENFDKPEEQFVVLDIDCLTNPNGEGNFEISPELYVQYLEDARSGKRRPYGYDANAKGLTIEDVRKLLGK
jgi:hypothetical protein